MHAVHPQLSDRADPAGSRSSTPERVATAAESPPQGALDAARAGNHAEARRRLATRAEPEALALYRALGVDPLAVVLLVLALVVVAAVWVLSAGA